MSKGKKILIVDDEPDLREVIADEFRFDGDQVYEAANGIEGLSLYQQEKPDVVISDIRMPGGDGVTLAKNIKKLDPLKSRVFLITGFADVSAAEAYQFGVEGFFTKPFHLEEIRQVIARSYLSPAERWQIEQERSYPVTAEINLRSMDWLSEFKAGVFPVGRGGFFLAQNRMIAPANPLRVGEMIALKAGAELLGYLVIRWVRSDTKDSEHGVGLEFVALEDSFLKTVLELTKNLSTAAYIPSKLTS